MIGFKLTVQILHHQLSPSAEGCCGDASLEFIQLLPCGKMWGPARERNQQANDNAESAAWHLRQPRVQSRTVQSGWQCSMGFSPWASQIF